MARHPKCDCGCGQAPYESCRQRLLECDGCPAKVRASRQVIAQVTLSCSCGGTLGAVCLFDRTCAGDRDAWAEYTGRAAWSAVQAERGRRGAAATNRWRKARAERQRVNAAAGRDDLPF
jgi:hypothetical protein